VHVIPESIDVDRFQFTEREFTGSIGILCHLGPRKRVYELILAFSELVKSNRSLRLYVGGDPHPAHTDYWSALQSLVRRLSLEDVVTFDGFVSDPPEWYRKIDIFVSNSYSEGLQVSPMEAMASGCYTLSHRWEGAEELLPGDCLYFTESELLCNIRRYCELPEDARDEQRARMRSIAATRFNIAVNAPRIAQLIDDAVSS
jgi:glycosyltransferase involved in cell wall biosynthesis